MFVSEKKADFAMLFRSLKFRSKFDAANSLVRGHLHRVQDMLEEFIRTHPGVDSEIKSMLLSLPAESFLRLLTSPYVCEMLMVRNEVEDEMQIKSLEFQVVQAIVAEIRRVVPTFKHVINPLWSSTGDIVFDNEVAHQFPPIQTDCGISLNYQSYAHNTGKSGIGGYSYDEVLKHKERIETGKMIVSKTSEEALSLIDQFATIIQFRRNLQRPNVVNSSSHTSIGLIRCDNFHKIHGDMPEIVDMLVHESIHQYLHLFEEDLFAFVEVENIPPDVLGKRSYPSPWSGNQLDLRSYTHAILVWYGLSQFWQRYIDGVFVHPEVSREAARKKLAEAHVGFLTTNVVVENLGEHRDFLRLEFLEEIERIQAEVKGMSGLCLEQQSLTKTYNQDVFVSAI